MTVLGWHWHPAGDMGSAGQLGEQPLFEWSGFPPPQSQVRRPWAIAVAVELGVLCRLRSVLPPGPCGFGEGSWVPR